jgi:hypothetical protein
MFDKSAQLVSYVGTFVSYVVRFVDDNQNVFECAWRDANKRCMGAEQDPTHDAIGKRAAQEL